VWLRRLLLEGLGFERVVLEGALGPCPQLEIGMRSPQPAVAVCGSRGLMSAGSGDALPLKGGLELGSRLRNRHWEFAHARSKLVGEGGRGKWQRGVRTETLFQIQSTGACELT